MNEQLTSLARRRLIVGTLLSLAMIGIYFGFVLLVAFNKALMATLVLHGLSLGIGLGVLVILTAWVLTGVYVRWANRSYDPAITRLRNQE